MKTLKQIILLTPHQFTSELWKGLLRDSKIEFLGLNEFNDFLHFVADLAPEVFLIDLKIYDKKENVLLVKEQVKQIDHDKTQIYFLGSQEEWSQCEWGHEIGSLIETPVDISLISNDVQSLFYRPQ